MKRELWRVYMAGLLLAIAGAMALIYINQQKQDTMEVFWFDVGQGSGALIRTPSGKEIVIDTGNSANFLREMGRKRSLFDRYIDVVMASHPDRDHMGMMPALIERYRIGTLLTTNKQSENSAYQELITITEGMNIPVQYVYSGDVYDFTDGVTMQVLYPFSPDASDIESNDSSIVVLLVYGSTTVLFTGDASRDVEQQLVAHYGELLDADVLVVGHHGSNTSSDVDFLSVVDPHYGVISVGENNWYGHPHRDVLNRLHDQSIQILRTDQLGTIYLQTDGTNIEIE